jgi:hypothetical protein
MVEVRAARDFPTGARLEYSKISDIKILPRSEIKTVKTRNQEALSLNPAERLFLHPTFKQNFNPERLIEINKEANNRLQRLVAAFRANTLQKNATRAQEKTQGKALRNAQENQLATPKQNRQNLPQNVEKSANKDVFMPKRHRVEAAKETSGAAENLSAVDFSRAVQHVLCGGLANSSDIENKNRGGLDSRPTGPSRTTAFDVLKSHSSHTNYKLELQQVTNKNRGLALEALKALKAEHSNELQKQPIRLSVIRRDPTVINTTNRQQFEPILQITPKQHKANIVSSGGMCFNQLPVQKCEGNGQAGGLPAASNQHSALTVALPHTPPKGPEFAKTNSYDDTITKTNFVAKKEETPCEVDAVSFFEEA